MSAERPSGDADDVIHSNAALSVVAGWLGMSVDAALNEAGPMGEPEAQQRPQFLGLGAKFLPHHKAVMFASALDSKLKRRLERGGHEGGGGGRGRGRGGTGLFGGPLGIKSLGRETERQGDCTSSSSGDDDDDGMGGGRSNAFKSTGASGRDALQEEERVASGGSLNMGSEDHGGVGGGGQAVRMAQPGVGRQGEGGTVSLTAKARQQQLLLVAAPDPAAAQQHKRKRKKHRKTQQQQDGSLSVDVHK